LIFYPSFKRVPIFPGVETGTVSSFPSNRITLNSHQNITLTNVSAFMSEESSFTVTTNITLNNYIVGTVFGRPDYRGLSYLIEKEEEVAVRQQKLGKLLKS
jgi:hypothetical protein